MKKLGLGILGLLLILAIYYFTAGSTQLTAQMKTKLNADLLTLQSKGFSVQEREEGEKEDHFLLSFDEPKKIAQYLSNQGMQLDINDATLLQGLKVGVDVTYLADTYSAISFDMYPAVLPTAITSSLLDSNDKITLKRLQEMIDKKTLLLHIAVNKPGTGFKGYMKDIDELFQGEQNAQLNIKGLTFSGDLKEDKLQNVTQNLEYLGINVQNELDMKLTDLRSHYAITGNTNYDYNTDYIIKNMKLDGKDQFNMVLDDISMQSVSTVKNGLSSGEISVKSKNIAVTTRGKKFAFETFTFGIKADNLDMTAFEKLQTTDITKEDEVNALMQQLISKGITIEIPTFSMAKIEAEGKKMDGFNLDAKISIDKSLDIKRLEVDPMATLNAIDANLNLTLSKEVFAIVAQQPEAMMTMMLVQPKTVNDNKVYKLELKDGKLTVNDTPMM